MKGIEAIERGYLTFRDGYFEENRNLFEALAAKGQSPQVMIISCCDSRVEPSLIFGAEPGDLFVVRNVANLVPPYEPDSHYHGTSAALEFAITSLKVRHIIILGHEQCGGINALLSGAVDSETSFIGKWMSVAEEARQIVQKTHPDLPESQQQRALEHRSIVRSLQNLRQFPFISEAIDAGVLWLHGWHFDIGTGDLLAYDPETDQFKALAG